MKTTTNEKFAEWFKAWTQKFAIEVIRFCNTLPNLPATQVIIRQLIKAATSAAANYRAACRGRSDNEFYSKICIVVEESDEALFWLEIIKKAEIKCDRTVLENLLKEAEEILSIIAKSKKTMEEKINRAKEPLVNYQTLLPLKPQNSNLKTSQKSPPGQLKIINKDSK